MSGPTINRGASSGDIWTPQVFIDAVERKFGPIIWDLACSGTNRKGLYGLYEDKVDSLTLPWAGLDGGDGNPHPLCWLNPPYSNITPWARKCAAESSAASSQTRCKAEILLLVPASIGANWYWDWVEPYADVYSVGRMVFDNCYNKAGELVTTPYPKDLILCHYYNRQTYTEMRRWRWKDDCGKGN